MLFSSLPRLLGNGIAHPFIDAVQFGYIFRSKHDVQLFTLTLFVPDGSKQHPIVFSLLGKSFRSFVCMGMIRSSLLPEVSDQVGFARTWTLLA